MLLVLSPYFCFSSVPVFLAFFVKAFSFFFSFLFLFFFTFFVFFFTFFVFSTLKKKIRIKKFLFFLFPPLLVSFYFFPCLNPLSRGSAGGGGEGSALQPIVVFFFFLVQIFVLLCYHLLNWD